MWLNEHLAWFTTPSSHRHGRCSFLRFAASAPLCSSPSCRRSSAWSLAFARWRGGHALTRPGRTQAQAGRAGGHGSTRGNRVRRPNGECRLDREVIGGKSSELGAATEPAKVGILLEHPGRSEFRRTRCRRAQQRAQGDARRVGQDSLLGRCRGLRRQAACGRQSTRGRLSERSCDVCARAKSSIGLASRASGNYARGPSWRADAGKRW